MRQWLDDAIESFDPTNNGRLPQFRITMAAVDPTEEPEADAEGDLPAVPRSTLRLVKRAYPALDDDEDDELDDEELRAMLAANGAEFSDDDDSEDDEEANGGPSDPVKAKKQKQAAAIKALLEATAAGGDDDDEDMEDAKPNGVKSKSKGKGKAVKVEEDEDEDDDEDSEYDSDEGADLDNFVICTLDTERVSYRPATDLPHRHPSRLTCCV